MISYSIHLWDEIRECNWTKLEVWKIALPRRKTNGRIVFLRADFSNGPLYLSLKDWRDDRNVRQLSMITWELKEEGLLNNAWESNLVLIINIWWKYTLGPTIRKDIQKKFTLYVLFSSKFSLLYSILFFLGIFLTNCK
jgi:hypothetical protein